MSSRKKPSLDETYNTDENSTKLNPYDRLQSLFSDKEDMELTESASDKLDYLLNKKSTKSENIFSNLYNKIVNVFKKFDNFIFRPRSRTMNTEFHSRKKSK